jgi:hypothetical protein
LPFTVAYIPLVFLVPSFCQAVASGAGCVGCLPGQAMLVCVPLEIERGMIMQTFKCTA